MVQAEAKTAKVAQTVSDSPEPYLLYDIDDDEIVFGWCVGE